MPFPQTPSPLANILAAKTYNAAWFSGSTKEIQIQNAINAAIVDGALYVYVPTNMVPYNASLIVFNTGVKMLKEGGHSVAFDVKAYGAAGNNIQDDTAAIIAADAGARAALGEVYFPSGIYVTSQGFSVSIRWFGVYNVSIIRPTNAVAKCIELLSSGILERLFLDGINTTSKIGLCIGTTLANITTVRDCNIWNFKGVGARGIEILQLVSGFFENTYVCRNYINLHTNGGNTPTDTEFNHCQFREATTKGVWIETGFGLRFIKPLFEANGEEGVYFQNVGGTAIEIEIDGGWSEANWLSLVSDPVNRALKYSLNVAGLTGPGGTIRIKVRNHKYDGETAKAINLTAAIAFLLDAVHVVPTGGFKIDIDAISYGQINNWPEQNGALNTKVSTPALTPGTPSSTFVARQHIEDAEAGWTNWVPVVTGGGTMTINTLTIIKARYKILGKRILIKLLLTFNTATAPAALVNVTLPTNVRTLDANEYNLAWLVDNAVSSVGIARGDGSNPTSSLSVSHFAGNWTVANAQQINMDSVEYEIF